MEIRDLQGFVDCLEDAVVVIDEDYRVVLANVSALQISGLKADELLHRPCHVAFHGQSAPCDARPHGNCAVRTARVTGQPARVRHHHLDANGFVHVVEIYASTLPAREGDSSLVLEVMREVTRQAELEAETAQRHRELSALNQITVAVASSMDPETLAPELLDLMIGALDVDGAAIYQVQKGLPTQIAARGTELPLGIIRAVLGEMTATDQPLVLRDLRSNAGWASVIPPGCKVGSLMCTVLSEREGGHDMLVLASSRPRSWPDAEVHLVGMAAQQISIGMERAYLFRALSDRAHNLEEANLRLRASEQARRRALQRAITAQEDERRRIAAELHDDTAQGLAALIVGMDTAIAMLAHSSAAAREQLVHLQGSASTLIEEIDSIIAALRPALLDDLGLLPALRAYAADRLNPLDVDWEFDVGCNEYVLPPQVEMALFRVVQEAINNIARHAQAHRVHIAILPSADGFTTQVIDDGVGFDVGEKLDPGRRQPSLGLLGMQERLAAVDGRLEIHSAPGQGTRLRIYVPIAAKGGQA